MLLEELTDCLGFVRGEIVEDDVNLLPRGAQGYDLLQKGDELTAGMAGSGFAVDATGGAIQCRIQRERAMPVAAPLRVCQELFYINPLFSTRYPVLGYGSALVNSKSSDKTAA